MVTKLTLNRFLLLFLFVLSSTVNAKGSLSSNIITATAFQTGGFFLYADNWPNPNNCTRTDAIVLLKSDTNYNKAYTLLLAAYMSGKKVSGYSDGCTTFDGQTYNTIRSFKYLMVR